MSDLPKFRRYTVTNLEAGVRIQPELGLRGWDDLTESDKKTVLDQLVRQGWIDSASDNALSAVEYLNRNFMRVLPGKRVHATVPGQSRVSMYGRDHDLLRAAYLDFGQILLTASGDLVMEMLSRFAEGLIDRFEYQSAERTTDSSEREKHLNNAFQKFDRFAASLNHMFEQFGIDQVVHRTGFAPRQDDVIVENLYKPTLALLADVKWKNVSNDLGEMFAAYRSGNFPEVITRAHSATQRFFQILAGSDEGKNGKGELKELVGILKKQGVLPSQDRFVEPVATAILRFLPAERAANSTAKPSMRDATNSEALLVMNTVLVLMQFCLSQ